MTYTQLPAILVKNTAQAKIDTIDRYRQRELDKLINAELTSFERRKNSSINKFFRKLFYLSEPIAPSRAKILDYLDNGGGVFSPVNLINFTSELQRSTAVKILKLADESLENNANPVVYVSSEDWNLISK